jgi:aminomethyltransferase
MPQRTPLYDWHVAHGARMVDFAGWDMPVQYTGIVEEHQAVRAAAGFFDISHMGRLLFQGPGSTELIDRVFTNNVVNMKPGQARYGLICNEGGGILDDVLVYFFPGPYWLMVVNASNREKILGWIERHRPARGVNLKDVTLRRAMIAVQGPRSLETMKAALAAWPYEGADAALRPAELPYYHAVFHGPWEDDEAHLTLSRTGYTGEDGFEIIVSSGQVAGFVDALLEAAGRLSLNVRPCGLGARDTLRLEAAMPLYGHELNEDIDPLQAGLAWAVKMNKGDFIGREALAQRKEDPTQPVRVGLELASKRIAREGAAVLREGKPIGHVTSGTFAPTVGKAIAMAYVPQQSATVGTALEVDIRGKSAPAHVVPLPFYQRKNR